MDLESREQTRYEDVSSAAQKSIEDSTFWTQFKRQYRELEGTYKARQKYDLFLHPEAPPKIQIKPYNSLIEKSFRKNVVQNRSYPDEPNGGWLLPPQWYENANDLIRTSIAVKYLDGVDHLVEALEHLATECHCKLDHFLTARTEGYYAAQVYVELECEVPAERFGTEILPFSFEIEITTQLQQVIKKLIHYHYERTRVGLDRRNPRRSWQWEYESTEFSANYLGHILHYLEGMIMQVRERQRSGEL